MGGAVSAGETNDELIDNLVDAKYITSRDIENVFRSVDRGNYYLDGYKDTAYHDMAWKHDHLHISAPCIYSEVMASLQLAPGLSFLNIGSGTGYLSTMAGLMLGLHGINHGIEIYKDVVEYAQARVKEFILHSPQFDRYAFCEPIFSTGNCLHLSADTPGYDRVYCGASCPTQYESFMKNLLNIDGILVMPFNDQLQMVTRTGQMSWESKNILPVTFASLLPPSPDHHSHVTLPERKPPSLQAVCRACVRRVLSELHHGPMKRPPRRRRRSSSGDSEWDEGRGTGSDTSSSSSSATSSSSDDSSDNDAAAASSAANKEDTSPVSQDNLTTPLASEDHLTTPPASQDHLTTPPASQDQLERPPAPDQSPDPPPPQTHSSILNVATGTLTVVTDTVPPTPAAASSSPRSATNLSNSPKSPTAAEAMDVSAPDPPAGQSSSATNPVSMSPSQKWLRKDQSGSGNTRKTKRHRRSMGCYSFLRRHHKNRRTDQQQPPPSAEPPSAQPSISSDVAAATFHQPSAAALPQPTRPLGIRIRSSAQQTTERGASDGPTRRTVDLHIASDAATLRSFLVGIASSSSGRRGICTGDRLLTMLVDDSGSERKAKAKREEEDADDDDEESVDQFRIAVADLPLPKALKDFMAFYRKR